MMLAAMLVQSDDMSIRILPAWGKGIDVDFRLPIGKNNFIEVEYKGGKIIKCAIDKPTDKQILFDEKALENVTIA